MKNLLGIAFILLIIGATGCADDDVIIPTVDVELNLKGKFGDDLLLMRKDYQLNDTTKVNFTRVSFYLSDVVLLKEIDGKEDETGLIDLELVDFTSFTEMNPGTADQGISYVGTNIPVDNYTGLKMGLGVPADLNRTSPDDQSLGDGHPLTVSLHYWQGWQSYMFAMIEGSIDLNHNGTFESDEFFKYHTGKDEAFDNTFMYQDLNFSEGNNPKLEVSIDLKRLFLYPDGSPVFDPSEKLSTHNPDDFPFIQQFMRYFSQIFSL